MAKNFRISANEGGQHCRSFLLFGDFDASSACELINRLDQVAAKTSRIAIDTDGLTAINTFGLDVFIPRMNQWKRTRADITVTGRFSEVFRKK